MREEEGEGERTRKWERKRRPRQREPIKRTRPAGPEPDLMRASHVRGPQRGVQSEKQPEGEKKSKFQGFPLPFKTSCFYFIICLFGGGKRRNTERKTSYLAQRVTASTLGPPQDSRERQPPIEAHQVEMADAVIHADYQGQSGSGRPPPVPTDDDTAGEPHDSCRWLPP